VKPEGTLADKRGDSEYDLDAYILTKGEEKGY
jgi:hypothetical protein